MQADHEAKRALYMDRKLTHEQFYEWLGETIRLSPRDLPCTLDEVRNSQDPHLNDIPLDRWDRMDPLVRSKAGSAGMQAWSLSDSVCCLKVMAKKWAAKYRPEVEAG